MVEKTRAKRYAELRERAAELQKGYVAAAMMDLGVNGPLEELAVRVAMSRSEPEPETGQIPPFNWGMFQTIQSCLDDEAEWGDIGEAMGEGSDRKGQKRVYRRFRDNEDRLINFRLDHAEGDS